VGYLSNNFRNHPTAHLLARLFGMHDRERFEVYAYSFGSDDGSDYRKQIEQDCDRFVELNTVTDNEAVKLIQEDKINILVDLVGFMQGHRMGICAQQPAPVQVRYLGMAGTTGADFFDYIIVDRTIVPDAHVHYYSEAPVYMPHCYQLNDDRQTVAEVNYTRSEFGLPDNALVYCSFASHYKLDPIMFAAWMRIIKQVANSVLWLTPGSKIAERNLSAQASAHGINSKRLVFADRLSKDQHLARLKLVDLALDTRLVSGAATTSDALWSGIPVITLVGNHFASRMSASLLRAMGIDELVVDDLAGYEALAVKLGNKRSRLKTLQRKVVEQKKRGNLFNTVQMVRNLEMAFDTMWKNYLNGNKPRTICL
jgi:protein O-GlcNAc transferase